jgi:hypothetical protein
VSESDAPMPELGDDPIEAVLANLAEITEGSTTVMIDLLPDAAGFSLVTRLPSGFMLRAARSNVRRRDLTSSPQGRRSA